MIPVCDLPTLAGGRLWRRGLTVVVLGIGLALAGSPSSRAQSTDDSLSLAERYRTIRVQTLVQQYLDHQGTLPVQPPRRIVTGADSLLAAADSARPGAETGPSFAITSVRRVRDLERSWFRERYREVEWSFLGTGLRLSFVDTIRTRDLRARLQARFGEPTRTLAEIYSNEWVQTPDSTREEPIQFEYWFVVNDSIPVRVSDVSGPGERGGIVSTDRRYRAELPALRRALLRPLRREERAPYADYYYEPETRRWYRVGYDGRAFFRERISRFDIVPGRRPDVEGIRSDSSAAENAEARLAPRR
jgi:hypothetical protein